MIFVVELKLSKDIDGTLKKLIKSITIQTKINSTIEHNIGITENIL